MRASYLNASVRSRDQIKGDLVYGGVEFQTISVSSNDQTSSIKNESFEPTICSALATKPVGAADFAADIFGRVVEGAGFAVSEVMCGLRCQRSLMTVRVSRASRSRTFSMFLHEGSLIRSSLPFSVVHRLGPCRIPRLLHYCPLMPVPDPAMVSVTIR